MRTINLTTAQLIFYAGLPAVIITGGANPNQVRPLKAVWIEKRILLSDLVEQYSVSVEELHDMNFLGPEGRQENRRAMLRWLASLGTANFDDGKMKFSNSKIQQ